MNLEAAFALQLRRIEAEWGAHEQQMAVDYMAQKSEIEGRQVAPSQVLSLAGPWKSKEKQSRLIHTAPVQSPDSKALQPLQSCPPSPVRPVREHRWQPQKYISRAKRQRWRKGGWKAWAPRGQHFGARSALESS